MNKEKALERLTAIELESKNLRKIIEDSDKPKNIMDRVKSFEDACEVLGSNPDIFTEYDTDDEVAYKKLKVITRALNENWKKDWSNSNEYIYFPWFEMDKKPGSGFDCSDYYRWPSFSIVSARLGFKSRELALYAAKQFEVIYHKYMVIK